MPEPGNTVLTFDDWIVLLKKKLPQMSYGKNLAFAASCCERSFPNYKAFASEAHWGEPEVLTEALELVWRLVLGQNPNDLHSYAKALIKAVEKITPDTEGDFNSLLTSAALDAATSLAESLDYALDQSTNHIVTISSLARDTIYLYVQHTENDDDSDADFEEKIAHHPLMTAELAKQELDLKTLESTQSLTLEFWMSFRQSATVAGSSNLGIRS